MNGAIDDQGTLTLRTDDELILAYNQPRTRITLRGRADPENGYLVGAVDYPTCERFVLVPGATSGNYLAAAAYAKVLAGGDEKARTAATVGNAPEVARAAPISAASVAAASVAASPVPAEPVASASVVPPAPPPARSSSAEPERAAVQREAVAVPAEASVLYLRALEAEGRGDNVQNLQEAAQLYERAARLGYIQAYTSLGYLYQTGAGVQSDTARAFDLYKRAAEGGHAEGAFQLAIAYINGIGTTRELSSARIWMRRAADSAHQHAQFALGEMFREGHGGNVNKFTARRYFDRASKGPDKEIADAARQFRDGIDGAELASDWWSKNSIVANVALFVGLTRWRLDSCWTTGSPTNLRNTTMRSVNANGSESESARTTRCRGRRQSQTFWMFNAGATLASTATDRDDDCATTRSDSYSFPVSRSNRCRRAVGPVQGSL